ncbi:unnamed protein product [Prorocentrum cordatum]|uniref:Uncharacterized protein n=1 Tax=Prorocentrum cordatum TaxID=2364126 RepID=A0ABN9SBU6_9DINO|nr:unnamed protein product [Polarella glacialis]
MSAGSAALPPRATSTPSGSTGKGKNGKADKERGKDKDKKGKAKFKRAVDGGARCFRCGDSAVFIRTDIPPCDCPGAQIDWSSIPGYADLVFVEDSDGDQTKASNDDNLKSNDEDKDIANDKNKDKDKLNDKDNEGDTNNINDTDTEKNADIVTDLGDVAAPPAWPLGGHVRLHGLNTASLNGTSGVISQLHAGHGRLGVQVHSGEVVAMKFHEYPQSHFFEFSFEDFFTMFVGFVAFEDMLGAAAPTGWARAPEHARLLLVSSSELSCLSSMAPTPQRPKASSCNAARHAVARPAPP